MDENGTETLHPVKAVILAAWISPTIRAFCFCRALGKDMIPHRKGNSGEKSHPIRSLRMEALWCAAVTDRAADAFIDHYLKQPGMLL